MRTLGVVGGLAFVGLALVVACSSSGDAATSTTTEAGADAPDVPPGEGGADGGTGTGDGVQHGGTRIKLRGITTSEGAFLYDAPFDSKFGTPCYPGRTEDGVLRCVPQAEASMTSFGDVNCSMPLAEMTKTACAKPTLATRYISSATDRCDTRFAIYTLGSVVDVAKIYTKDVGGCVERAASSTTDYFSVLAAVPATDLVALTETLVPVTPELAAYVLDGNDGSRIQSRYFSDVKRGKPCDANPATDGQLHCTPRAKAATYGFSDVGCTMNAAVPAECVVPFEQYDDSTASRIGLQSCDQPKVRVFTLAAKRASRDEYRSDGDGGCVGPATSPRDVYDVGAELLPATLPAMTAAAGGGPRIVERTLANGGVIVQRDGSILTDTTLGTKCSYATAADGKLRCLPTDVTTFAFSDDKCLVPLGAQVEDCGPVKYVVRIESGTCRVLHVHVAGTKIDPLTTQVFQRAGVDCVPVGGSNVIAYYTLGAEVPASTFEEGTTVTK